jgi:hypothetical protein
MTSGPFKSAVQLAQEAETAMLMAVYGTSKCGKTYFAGTFPNPVILNVKVEAGASTLIDTTHPNHENIKVYDIPQPGMTALDSMNKAVDDILANKDALNIKSVALDTVTVYIDLLYNEFTNYGRVDMWSKGGENKWQILTRHMLEVRDRLHSAGLHVLWTFHTEEIFVGGQLQSLVPRLSGKKFLQSLLATTHIYAYLDKVNIAQEDGTAQTVRRLWVRCPHNMLPQFSTGIRWENLIRDNLYIPDFEQLAQLIPFLRR